MAFPVINEEMCTACGICVDDCPSDCFDLEDTVKFTRRDDCTECDICYDSCPNGAISLED